MGTTRDAGRRKSSNPRYADAKPTWFDLLARDIGRFLADLFSSGNGANVGPSALIIVTVIIAAALIAALIIWEDRAAPARSGARPATSSEQPTIAAPHS